MSKLTIFLSIATGVGIACFGFGTNPKLAFGQVVGAALALVLYHVGNAKP